MCYCKRYTLQALGSYNANLGDVGALCVGADGPVHVADPLDETDTAWQDEGYPAADDEVRTWCSDRCSNENKSFGDPASLCEDPRWSEHKTHPAWDPSKDFNCVLPDELNVDDPDGSDIEWDLVAAPGVDDTEALFGQAEYTAVECQDDVCPFFLANLSAFNTTDSWAIQVWTAENKKAKKVFSNLQVDLLQSVIGVRSMALDVVAFAPGSLRFLAQFTVEGTGIGAGDHAYLFENLDYVFAEYDAGSLSLTHVFDVQSNGGEATLTIEIVPDEHPPVAEHDLGATEPCDWVTGIELENHDVSTDPDNDIVFTMWWIDGATCIEDCWVPLRTHDVALEVHDARGAVSYVPEQSVTVTNGPNCALGPQP
jgi:hypothetical protein